MSWSLQESELTTAYCVPSRLPPKCRDENANF
jgi:hypothetical protein